MGADDDVDPVEAAASIASRMKARSSSLRGGCGSTGVGGGTPPSHRRCAGFAQLVQHAPNQRLPMFDIATASGPTPAVRAASQTMSSAMYDSPSRFATSRRHLLAAPHRLSQRRR